MQYIHVKNLEKYHPGYKDRNLQWCKTYFTMINSNPDFEMLEEIDKWRLVAFIMLELQLKKPIPSNSQYLTRKGFDLKKRPISLSLKMLHNFVVAVTEDEKLCGLEEDKEEEKEEEKEAVTKKSVTAHLTDLDFIKELKNNPAYKHVNIDRELGKMEAWLLTHRGRQKTRKFIVNWLNKIDAPVIIKKPEPKPEPIIKPDPNEQAKVAALIRETKEKMRVTK